MALPFYIETECSDNKRHELSHWHNSIELIEVLDGHYHCHVNEEHFITQKGQLCIINKGRIHRIMQEMQGTQEHCLKKTLIFNPDDIVQDKESYEKYILPLMQDDAFSHMQFFAHKGIGKEIVQLIDTIDDLNTRKPEGFELEAMALLYMLVRRLYLAYERKKHELSDTYNSNIHIQRRMTTFIYEHFGEKIGLDDIAAAGNISRSTCIRFFNEYTGKSPIDFLNSYRLEVSCQLLQNDNQRITDIAQRCGFTQQSYYNRMFRKEFGLTPNEWRKQLKEENCIPMRVSMSNT